MNPCEHPESARKSITWNGSCGEDEWCSECGAHRGKYDGDLHWKPWNLPACATTPDLVRLPKLPTKAIWCAMCKQLWLGDLERFHSHYCGTALMEQCTLEVDQILIDEALPDGKRGITTVSTVPPEDVPLRFDFACDAREEAISSLSGRVIGALERRLEDKHGTGTEGDGAIRSMLIGLEALLR